MRETPRETAGVTTRLIVTYVRRSVGDDGVAEMLTQSRVPHALADLEDERFWCSYDDKIALLRAAGEVLHDPAIGRHIGESLFEAQVGAALRLVIGSLGSPQGVLRSVAKANAKFSTSGTMATLSATPRGGVVTYRLHPPNRPHRLDCDYTQGILSQVSVLFGMPPAGIVHTECQVEGAEACRFEVSWVPRRFRDRLRRHTADIDTPFEADALREQLADLQRTVADLVSTPDLDELLRRIASRAGASVRGQRYLLAVQLQGEPEPRFHSEGFAAEETVTLGRALLAGEPATAGAIRITADVASSQRRYGWLAAEMPPGHGFLPTEQEQLDAYGRLAAAALDAATALEAARARGEAAQALLQLGRDLAREEDEAGVARRVSEAAPMVTGAARASVLFTDGASRSLQVVAAHGYGDDTERAMGFRLPFDATPAATDLERAPTPTWATPDHPEPFVRALVHQWSASVAATAPLVVHGRLAGVLLALWDEAQPPRASRRTVLQQLSALADQASTALSAARSLEEARHQATHDALTGLSNRVLFTARIEHALAEGRRSGRHPAVCFVDLDGFKAVNDDLGHAAGDELLIQVGTRIQACVRESDAVARLSGDEFGVLVREVDLGGDAEVVAGKIVQALGQPFHVTGREVRIGASVGVSIAPTDGASPDELLRTADDAMYRAKVEGSTYRLARDVRDEPQVGQRTTV